MWIFLNDAFLSIVADRDNGDNLLVRARFPGDITTVFPSAEVAETRRADYRFRARLSRAEVASAIAQALASMTATNFKNSVRERWRHDVYLNVWGVMSNAQHKRAG